MSSSSSAAMRTAPHKRYIQIHCYNDVQTQYRYDSVYRTSHTQTSIAFRAVCADITHNVWLFFFLFFFPRTRPPFPNPAVMRFRCGVQTFLKSDRRKHKTGEGERLYARVTEIERESSRSRSRRELQIDVSMWTSLTDFDCFFCFSFRLIFDTVRVCRFLNRSKTVNENIWWEVLTWIGNKYTFVNFCWNRRNFDVGKQ